MINFKLLREELLETHPTLYCCVMAHLRGKLHMTKAHISTLYSLPVIIMLKDNIIKVRQYDVIGYNNPDYMEVDYELQYKCIEYLIDRYTIVEEEE